MPTSPENLATFESDWPGADRTGGTSFTNAILGATHAMSHQAEALFRAAL